MTPPKSIIDGASPLCIDASVAINLNATLLAERILIALPMPVLITRSALGELRVDHKNGRDDAALTSRLIGNGSLGEAVFNEDAEGHFLRLTVGDAAETLDDGEAATIAHAASTGAISVLDERKATLLCARLFPRVRVVSSLDVLAHPAVEGFLGAKVLGDAVFAALNGARMRVPPPHIDWSERVVGAARLETCESIPLDVRMRLRRKIAGGTE
ncbi:MAG: hypothetical protein ABL864_11560 [Terricaulis sp.]